LGVTAAAGYVYFLTWKKVRRDDIEMRSAKLALTPLLMAERDREYVSGTYITVLAAKEYLQLLGFLCVHFQTILCFEVKSNKFQEWHNRQNRIQVFVLLFMYFRVQIIDGFPSPRKPPTTEVFNLIMTLHGHAEFGFVGLG
jgi:hypothetical protein